MILCVVRNAAAAAALSLPLSLLSRLGPTEAEAAAEATATAQPAVAGRNGATPASRVPSRPSVTTKPPER